MRTNSNLYLTHESHPPLYPHLCFVCLLLGATSLFPPYPGQHQDVFLPCFFRPDYGIIRPDDLHGGGNQGLFGRVGNTPYRLSRFNLLQSRP